MSGHKFLFVVTLIGVKVGRSYSISDHGDADMSFGSIQLVITQTQIFNYWFLILFLTIAFLIFNFMLL